ncbi:MAG TPA: carotenoid biosynthesis protein [Candidatus Binatia bacterium]|jgi:putative membrane protein
MIVVAWILLAIQAAIVIASLLGYGIFTSRPDLLVRFDPQAKFFGWAFHGFAVGNMLFGGLAVCAAALGHDKQRALWAILAVYAVSLGMELLGTTYGIPFGAYSYTSLLGVKWFDRVPVLIPLSWFTVSWACWLLARRVTGGLAAVLFSTCLLVAWDLLLDPAMSRVTSYWVWGETGVYYGMPLMNLAGWGVTGLLLLYLISRLLPAPQGDTRFAAWVYLVNFALPFGFCVLNRYWFAALIGPLSIALAYGVFAKLRRARDFSTTHLGAAGQAAGLWSQRRE